MTRSVVSEFIAWHAMLPWQPLTALWFNSTTVEGEPLLVVSIVAMPLDEDTFDTDCDVGIGGSFL